MLVPVAERVACKIGAIDVPNERSLHTIPRRSSAGSRSSSGSLVSAILFLPMGAADPGDAPRRAGDRRRRRGRRRVRAAARAKMLGPDRRRLDPGVQRRQRLGASRCRSSAASTCARSTSSHRRWSATSTSASCSAIIGIVAVINVINFIDGVDGLAAGVCVISAATLVGHRPLARSQPAPGSWPRSPPAARSASCATASRRRRASWATPARTCSATCWR